MFAVMPIKPLEFKLNGDDATLSLHGSGATAATVQALQLSVSEDGLQSKKQVINCDNKNGHSKV